jgi:TPR repeat protein
MNRNKPGSLLIKITSLTLMMMLLLTAVPAQAQTQQELYQQGLDALYGQNGAEKNPEQALIIWGPLALDGYAPAQSALGYLYLEGIVVEQDLEVAIGLFEEAAKQGDAYAQERLGYLYYNGRGVPQDYAQAKSWYEKAALRDKPDEQALYQLGMILLYGLGTEADPTSARGLFTSVPRNWATPNPCTPWG